VIFRDLVVESLDEFDEAELTALDIGCGHGFDGDVELQRSTADRVHAFVGIEPDTDIPPPEYFTRMHRGSLEESDLEPKSVHVAYATFVLEHLKDPEASLRKIHESLAPGDVFWAFTVDARHPFTFVSKTMERLGLKGIYLNVLRGRRGRACSAPGRWTITSRILPGGRYTRWNASRASFVCRARSWSSASASPRRMCGRRRRRSAR
jgi:hypothetical protein